jgi:iron complex transport system ATP-binding protein
VNFARALAQIWTPPGEGPRYLLLDEPTASLDPRHQHLVMRMVSRLAAAGVGVLVILHDVNLASRYADDAVLLKGGSVVARGAVDTVLREDCLATAFDLPMRALTVPGLAQPIIIAVDSNEAEPRVDGGRRS